MGTMRGIPLGKQKLWAYFVSKEDELRLKWFKRNEARLEEIANRDNKRKVPQEVLEELKRRTQNAFEKGTHHHVSVPREDVQYHERVLTDYMKPVEEETLKLLQAREEQDNRMKYLAERYKIIPEMRYYFPETTSFVYGWHMWDAARKTGGSPHVRLAVLKDSFYRRRGVDTDPEWYKEPATLSPQVCGQM